MRLTLTALPTPELLPAYAASFVASAAAIASISMTLDPCTYITSVLGFLVLGYAASVTPVLFEERLGQSLRTGALAATLILIPAISLWISPAAILPDEALATADLRTAVLMGWLLVGLTFVVRAPRAGSARALPLSFLAVPSLTVFGLIATINPNPEIVVAFLLFLAATLFLVSYEQMLAKGLIALDNRRTLSRVIHEHALVSGSLFGVVFLLACLGMVLLSHASPTYAVGSAVARIRSTGQRYFYQTYGSWASQLDSFRVGAGPSPTSDTVLMTVGGDGPCNLRGRAYAEYTGHGWQQGFAATVRGRRLWQSRDGSFQIQREVLPHHELVTHNVEMVIDMPNVLFSAGIPYSVRGGRSRTIRVDPYGGLHSQSIQHSGTAYTVESMVPNASLSDLRCARGVTDGDSAYLTVPNSATAVFELAQKITADAATHWIKTEAITQWLGAHCAYDDVAARVPASADVAHYFLSKSRRGACDQWATAAALLCRAAGVPARVVVGYALSERSPETGRYLARERDAHAWIEVLIPEYGWIPVDPTAGSGRATGAQGLFDVFVGNASFIGLVRWVRAHAFWTVFLILCAYLAWLLVGGLREDRQVQAHLPGRTLSGDQRTIVAAYLHLCKRMARLGLTRDQAQTPTEFLQALLAHSRLRLPSDLVAGATQLTEDFCRVRYAEQAPEPEAVQRATRLRRALPSLLRATGRTPRT